MKKIFLINLSILICMFAGISDVMASPCPAGCFCLNNGESVFAGYQSVINSCYQSATIGHYDPNVGGEYCGVWVGGSMLENMDYYYDEFSVFYEGEFGFYGFIDNEFVYGNHCNNIVTSQFFPSKLDDIFQCPVSHPHSAIGAKALTECYKYDASGNKVYYGANTNIVCAEGTYLPANTTQCIACNASQNQVCPGGRFEKSDKIQGLRLNCGTGQYLPANATQCSVCDESQYFCFGGIYEYNSTEDQGRIAHNGYVNMGAIHTFITCDPGKYVPANTNQCSACTGDYICPGGIFFTDATYNVDRGKKLCPYGQPSPAHTKCVGKSTKPSYAREHFQAIEFASGMKEKIGSKETTGGVKVREQEVVNIAEKETSKNMEQKQMLKQKINDAKLAMPSENRSVSQRPESMRMTETGTVNKKTFIHRAARTMQKTPVLEQVENVRDRPERKRPSRYK